MPTPDVSALTDVASKVITVSYGGKFFRASQRTYAQLLLLQSAVAMHKKGAYVYVIQPCYNTGVALSAGTHDFDATVDIKIVGFTWEDMQSFCRRRGWAAWWRHTGSWASPSAWHIHMTSVGAAAAGCQVGSLIPGQISDYYNHRSGLVGHVADPTWHPKDINATIFKYSDWLEANMQLSDAQIDKIATAVTAKILNTQVGPDDDQVTVRRAMYNAHASSGLVGKILAKLDPKPPAKS